MLPASQHDVLDGEQHQSESSEERNSQRRDTNGRPKQSNTEGTNGGVGSLETSVNELATKLARIESVLGDLHELVANRQTIKDSYTTQEVAKILEKRPYTVREWCRLQRVNAFKAMCGRGCEEEWRITHEELLRIQNEGLLPVPERY